MSQDKMERLRRILSEARETRFVRTETPPVDLSPCIFVHHFPHSTFYGEYPLTIPNRAAELLDSFFSCPSPSLLAFLDVETTGLSAGTGNYVFLAGIGRYAPEGFLITQVLLSDVSNERAFLQELVSYLHGVAGLVTYNGRVFDWPLLETRFRLNRMPEPEIPFHLDLLYPARRLFSGSLPSCSLQHIEYHVLNAVREGDIPSHLIPAMFWQYQRTRDLRALAPVLEHNKKDVLALASLLSALACMAEDPQTITQASVLLGLGRAACDSGNPEKGLPLVSQAIRKGIPEPHLSRALRHLSASLKRAGLFDLALQLWESHFHPVCLVEMAKYFEHTLCDIESALSCTERCISSFGEDADDTLRRRWQRLRKKLAR
ncbi:MAG: ribonuclease H-like domain-containing protein [Bacillota bacterium]